eukprot:s4198_g3.t1
MDDEPHSNLVYMILFIWCAAMTLLGLAALFMVWRRLRAIEINTGHLELQVAQDDDRIGQHMVSIPQLQESMVHLREQTTEYSQHMEMLADSVDGIHFGLVQLGGFAQHRELTPAARRRMFEIERGNVVAMNAMGTSQYSSVVRQQSRGYARAGDDTDPVVEEDDDEDMEGGESSGADDDPLLNPERDLSTRAGELTTTIDDLRAELNQALCEESWTDAADIQTTILMLLDNMHNHGMSDPETRTRVFTTIADSFSRLTRRAERYTNNPTIVARYRSIEERFRSRVTSTAAASTAAPGASSSAAS